VLFAFVGASAVVAAGCTGLGVSRSTWAFAAVQISELSGAGYTGEGVTVAIVDTGIDLGHPNLKGVTLVLWVDLVNSMPDPYDDNGHGTAMASIMVGRGSLAGGAPGVSLIVIKAISGDGSGSDEIVATAINAAASHGADIISLSLGGSKPTLILGSASTQAVQSAASLGVLVVGSAGNDGENDDGQVASPGVANAGPLSGALGGRPEQEAGSRGAGCRHRCGVAEWAGRDGLRDFPRGRVCLGGTGPPAREGAPVQACGIRRGERGQDRDLELGQEIGRAGLAP
jgi:subtilisin family serine protease